MTTHIRTLSDYDRATFIRLITEALTLTGSTPDNATAIALAMLENRISWASLFVLSTERSYAIHTQFIPRHAKLLDLLLRCLSSVQMERGLELILTEAVKARGFIDGCDCDNCSAVREAAAFLSPPKSAPDNPTPRTH